MSSKFKLYADCKLVSGHSRYAIYDLTRNNIYIIPKDIALLFSDNTIDLSEIPEEKQSEYRSFLIEKELGCFDAPREFVPLSNEFTSPSIISDAIIDIGMEHDIPLCRIAKELSNLICENVCIRFKSHVSEDFVIRSIWPFMRISATSIEVHILYKENIANVINRILEDVWLCTRIIVLNAPFRKTEVVLDEIPILYTQRDSDYTSCRNKVVSDFSLFANANLNLYCESLKYNNCLHKKIYIDADGNIRNCPETEKTFGNIKDGISLLDVVSSKEFRKYWNVSKDQTEKCRDCELRYACQHCIMASQHCSYNVYED